MKPLPSTPDAPVPPWSEAGMKPRRELIFKNVRRCFRPFVDRAGRWQHPPAARKTPDPRVYVQVALAYLHGSEEDRQLAETLLLSEGVAERLATGCAFTGPYVTTLLRASGDILTKETRERLMARLADDLLGHARRDLRFHGYNDNHVSLATSHLVLTGELLGQDEAIEEGRANLLNFRDTLLRRGFIHEVNDCYIPHTLYPLAAIAEWAADPEIQELARDCEARIWADWIGHWHVNLARKIGPSARDYTRGRLDPLTFNTALWTIFGNGFGQPAFPPQDSFAEEIPADRRTNFNGNPNDSSWNLGFLTWMAAHVYHVPPAIAHLIIDRAYPHIIQGTHETGHFSELQFHSIPGTGAQAPQRISRILADAIPFSAREIFTYQYQEEDWGMGTASQRMIGNCPNNNWSIAWRKAAPLERTPDQGMLFASFTINDKSCTGNHSFFMDASDPSARNDEDVEHWFDNGKYAAVQQERTAILLYRPRIHDRHVIESLATSLIIPRGFGNHLDRIDFGDQDVGNFDKELAYLDDIFIQDGPIYIGIRPLIPVVTVADVRVRMQREEFWDSVHFYTYRGPAVSLEEIDLCRIGGGFLCEVATRTEFDSLEAFKDWFRRGRVLDEQENFMRHVRYHRAGLDLGLRWDVWADNLMYRTLNGREYPMPKFDCTGIQPGDLPWLTGATSGMDHFHWAIRQARRERQACPDPALKIPLADFSFR